MIDPLQAVVDFDRWKRRYSKDAAGHEHDPANGQFTGSGGGSGRKHEKHGDAKVGDTVTVKFKDFRGAPPLGADPKKKTAKVKITRVNKNGTYDTDDGGTIAAKDVLQIH